MSSESMRERLALAVYRVMQGYEPGENTFKGPMTPKSKSGQALAIADAVLDAIMVPTQGMNATGQNQINLLENPDPPNAFKFLSHEEVVRIWQAMILAAKEGK